MHIKDTFGTQTLDLFDLQSITAHYGNTTSFLFSVNYFWTSMGICRPLQPETLKVSCLGTRAKEIKSCWASKHQQQCVLQSWAAGSGTLAPNKNRHDNGRHAVFGFRQVREGRLQLKENSSATEESDIFLWYMFMYSVASACVSFTGCFYWLVQKELVRAK